MKYTQIQELDEEKFRRLTGVKPTTFKRMVEILSQENSIKKQKGGRPNKT